ncbi:hypothetical protein PC116_g23 [Phytophthora cactorum]|nr:hypothetical protein Pcac1_g10978 [Phytophthora cactorum]KAG2847781.1 hypothetical protein PC111_g676 [Phytophthora cactorum]KAG2849813.1 hypothetical protein PC112_g24 [Phytophthora cactorum]KAG2869272.1 hypothetical protein PC113_g275 [Phytophthora cactorum]KAG2936389.1 hypothetical protein PC114_g300 [Phytophthora cactorum]
MVDGSAVTQATTESSTTHVTTKMCITKGTMKPLTTEVAIPIADVMAAMDIGTVHV